MSRILTTLTDGVIPTIIQDVNLDIDDNTININFNQSTEATLKLELFDGQILLHGWLNLYSDEPSFSIEVGNLNNPNLLPTELFTPRLKKLEEYIPPEYTYDNNLLIKLYKYIHTPTLTDFEDPFTYYSKEELTDVIVHFFDVFLKVETDEN